MHAACAQVRAVPEDSESVEALRLVMGDVTADNFVLMSVDLITNVRLQVRGVRARYLVMPAQHAWPHLHTDSGHPSMTRGV